MVATRLSAMKSFLHQSAQILTIGVMALGASVTWAQSGSLWSSPFGAVSSKEQQTLPSPQGQVPKSGPSSVETLDASFEPMQVNRIAQLTTSASNWGQSFTAQRTGALSRIEVLASSCHPDAPDIVLTIRTDTSIGGRVVLSTQIPGHLVQLDRSCGGTGPSFVGVNISSLSKVHIRAGQVYTIWATASLPDQGMYWFTGPDDYAGGTMFFNGYKDLTEDFGFKTYVLTASP